MKIREMTLEQRREYYRNKTKEWRLRNPEKNKELRKKYKQSEKGKIANKKYESKRIKKIINDPKKLEASLLYHRNYYRNNPTKYNRSPEYIKNYMKEYIKDIEKHRKFLIRQKDRLKYRKQLLEQKGFCQICGSINNLEIHHKDYDEKSNIILLCRKCHRFLHRKQ
ncbi:MAG: HNH endonuclease [Spirochaetia bacterium]|nr:HNH endonuclease [Spirochaetia bacterium]